MEFDAFFRKAFNKTDNLSFHTFDYQRQLEGMSFGVNKNQSWPDLLDVSTGMGKTTVITLPWLWKRGWREAKRVEAPHPGALGRKEYDPRT